MKSKSNALSVEEAAGLLLERVSGGRKTEHVPLLEASGRICGRDMYARLSQPPFPRSPLDGYAVRHEDLAEANREQPAILRVCGTVYAGDWPAHAVKAGEAVRIMTGAPIPEGADCVVRQEDTRLLDADEESGRVAVFVSLKEYQNYCFLGEDILQGELMVRRGTRLTSGAIGLLASQGIEEAEVFCRPRVAVLSTGSELIKPGTPLEPGRIYDSNRLMLTACAAEKGAEVVSSVSVPDDPELIAGELEKALACSEFVICTGGVSVGRHDYMERVGHLAGADILFHGVKVKPGSPVLALEKDGKLILCLSGNPYAAFATFVLLALPVVRKLQGCIRTDQERRKGVMRDSFPKASPGRRFVRAFIQDGEISFPGTGHASGMIASLAGCNCMIDVPAGNPGLSPGDEVEAVLF